MKPDRGSRRISLRSGFSGVSTIRTPMGSFWPPSTGIHMPPRLAIFGTVAVSTTRIHGVHFIDPKYSADALQFLGCHRLRDRDHDVGVRLARLRALAAAFTKVVHRLQEVGHGQPRDAGVLLPALAVGIVAEAARAHVGPPAVGHDLRHRRVIAGEPVGRAKTIGNLLPREGEGAPGDLLGRRVGRRGRIWRSARWRRGRDRIRPVGHRSRRARQARRGEADQTHQNDGVKSAHKDPPR